MTEQDIKKTLEKIQIIVHSNKFDDEILENSTNELIDLIIQIEHENKSEFLTYFSNAIITLEGLLSHIEINSRQYYFTKAFIDFANCNYDEYLANIDTYIKMYIAEKKSINYESAYLNFFYIFDNLNNNDETLDFNKFLKKFHAILKKYCSNSAFGHYVKYILTETSNQNIREKYLLEILEKDEHWAVAYVDLGDIHYQNEDWQETINCYEKAIKESELLKTDELYFFLALSYSKIKNYSKEEENYLECLNITPSYPNANNNLGYCLYKQKRYVEAVPFFDNSIKLGTDKYFPFRNKFETLKKLGKNAEAIELVMTSPEYFNTRFYKEETEKIAGGKVDLADIFEKLKETTTTEFAGEIEVANGMSGIKLYAHQQEAIKNMNNIILNADTYSGLLVLPTGGGKTLTATYWLMNSLLDKGRKIVWLAHRHELLNQAQQGFEKVCYTDITKNKPSYNWRIISGQHDKPIRIKSSDDIIIASKTSLKRGMDYFLNNWLKTNGDKVFLIIDEAHHATASEYRDIIETIKANTIKFQMLGLTATPFRTADNEQGLLKKIFPDDIVYKIDLRTLINRGILSEPIFKSISTNVNMTELFQEYDSEASLERITKDSFFDIESIGGTTAAAIANNSQRNNAIVNEYVKNKDTYKQTLVFALNKEMAIVLNKLFQENGIRSDFVVSAIKDMVTQVTISSEENNRKIKAFRNGELDVLVNVNILTEGTDLPAVQSIFLTRPTKSTILMTQMIGRALRGEKAGGTKNAHIVSFIDDWQDKIAWVNPEQLFIDENVDFTETNHETQKHAMRLVSISKIEEFAKIANDTIDSRLSELAFIDRIPVGIYKFSYLVEGSEDEELDKSCNILVYDCMQKAYSELFSWLPTANLSNIESATNHADATLFGTLDMLLGYSKQDIIDIIMYYKQTQEIPQMIFLSERKNYDVSIIAQYIVEHPLERKDYIENEWKRSDTHWSALFGIEHKKAFRKLINDAIDQIENPEDYQISKSKPIAEKEKIQIQELPLYEIRRRFPDLEEKIRSTIFEKYTDTDGFYYSADSGYRSKNRLDFQVDHIIPMAHGGLTILDNLQLLTRIENICKSDK